ncbi:MAG: bifunctional metallophosphatase/5'-nucleotidase [Deltaproteobacteria bacterium]|nr:bifunctional metallophosphatase/5'-nucleotidase [Deltaproteobacteria bacterium]
MSFQSGRPLGHRCSPRFERWRRVLFFRSLWFSISLCGLIAVGCQHLAPEPGAREPPPSSQSKSHPALSGDQAAKARAEGTRARGRAKGTRADRARTEASNQPPLEVQILAFNDFHGHLEPPDGDSGTVMTLDAAGHAAPQPAGGVAFFAEHVRRLRARYRHTVLVSAGDLIGASPLVSALFHDEPTVEAMNLLGLDLNAVGNHEFDRGQHELRRMQHGGCFSPGTCAQNEDTFSGAKFGFLAANVIDKSSGETLFPAYEVRTFEGIQVAFIGLTLEGTRAIVNPKGIEGLEFRAEVDTINRLVPDLQKQGVEAIVVLIHEGGLQTGVFDGCEGISGPIVEIVKQLDPAVDFVASGHTHRAYNCVIANRRVTSALSYGRLLTEAILTIDRSTHDVIAIEAHNRVISRDIPEAADERALVDRYVERVADRRDRVVGRAAESMRGPNAAPPEASGESALGNLIADAQLEATKAPELGGAQISFMNPGGIRSNLEAGPITYGQIFAMQPFRNTLVTMTLTGSQIHRLLEQQFQASKPRVLQPSRGFSYTMVIPRARRPEVEPPAANTEPERPHVDPASMKLLGKRMTMDGAYRVTVNSFLAAGGDGFTVLAEGTDRRIGPLDLEAFATWLEQHAPARKPKLGRIRVVRR